MFAKVEKKGEEKGVKFNLGFLLRELAFFGVVVGVGVFAGSEIFRQGLAPDLEEVGISVLDFVIGFAIALTAILLLIRFVKSGTIFRVFFGILIFAGTEVFFSVWLPDIPAVAIAAVITAWRFLRPTVLSQNIAISMAVIGIGVIFGVSLDVMVVLIILAIFSVYDVVAVLKTGHMQKMFGQLLRRGAVFSILIPTRARTWGARLRDIGVGARKGVLVLGTGDLVFPIMFAVASLRLGWQVGVGVLVGSLFGILILHWLFLLARRPRPLPALPPIFAGSLCGFLIMLLVG